MCIRDSHRPARAVRADRTAVPRPRDEGGQPVRRADVVDARMTTRMTTRMRLTVIGCSGSYPGPDSAASCYLVEAEHEGRLWRILLDLGSGSLGTLQRYVDPLEIDAVFITHLHPDHFFDISGYYVLRKHHPAGPQPIIP